jgi:hypothetical protein
MEMKKMRFYNQQWNHLSIVIRPSKICGLIWSDLSGNFFLIFLKFVFFDLRLFRDFDT